MGPLLIASILSPLLPLLTGIRKRKTLPWLYCLLGLSADLLIVLLRRVLEVNYKIVTNSFFLLEFIIVTFLFSRLFISKKFFYTTLTIPSIFFIVSTIMLGADKNNYQGGTVFYFIYILYGLAGLYSILAKQEFIFLEKSWFFWLAVTFTIYASGAFLLFLFLDYLMALDSDRFMFLWRHIFLVLNVLKNCLFVIIIFCYPKPIR